jgi:hypothetical protein
MEESISEQVRSNTASTLSRNVILCTHAIDEFSCSSWCTYYGFHIYVYQLPNSKSFVSHINATLSIINRIFNCSSGTKIQIITSMCLNTAKAKIISYNCASSFSRKKINSHLVFSNAWNESLEGGCNLASSFACMGGSSKF